MTVIKFALAALAILLASPAIAQPSDVYLGLRSMAFEASAEDIGLTNESPYGLIVDWHVGSGVATIVTYATGDASLYLETGGGIIGGYAHERVREAALNAVREGGGLTGLEPASGAPGLPTQEGQVTITVLRPEGAWTLRVREDDLWDAGHPAHAVWMSTQAVITELRQVAGS